MRKIIIILFVLAFSESKSQIINASPAYYYRVPATVTYDTDAQKFIDSAGISGSDATAINNLVIKLKDSAVWTKLDFIYPFIGSTSGTQQWNLKNPAFFKLIFNGTWSHSSTGADPAANNTSYANTQYIPSSSGNMNTSSVHMSIDIVEAGAGVGASNWDMGAYNGETQALIFSSLVNGSVGQFYNLKNNAAFANSFVIGYFISNLETSSNSKLYQFGTQVNQNTNATGTLPTHPIYLGSMNFQGSNYSSSATGRKMDFATAGQTLTSTEIRALNNIVLAYKTEIGR